MESNKSRKTNVGIVGNRQTSLALLSAFRSYKKPKKTITITPSSSDFAPKHTAIKLRFTGDLEDRGRKCKSSFYPFISHSNTLTIGDPGRIRLDRFFKKSKKKFKKLD